MPEKQQLLTGSNSTADQRQAALVEELNQVLRNDALFDPQRFAAVALSGKARRLAAQEPTDEDLVRLNRMLLESAYPAEVVKSRMHTLRVANYYIAGGLVLLLLVLLRNLVDSRVGRALRAIHDRETAANAMGINTANYKLKAFVLSAMIAAMAGVFFTHYTGGIGPSEAGAFKSVRYVALAAAGGMASLWGVTAMSTILNYLSLRGLFGSFDHAVFGAILIIIVSVAPEGPLKPLGQWIGRWVKAGRARVTRELGGSGEPPGHGSPPAPPEGGTRTERRPDYGAA
ncbi:MAG: branched-chain amino acid ABC transporter permease [Verrucomicrobia bacterium]|nr:branched-chain amino acid ABC transporter permease [Verrucomicrobiota bacterium]